MWSPRHAVVSLILCVLAGSLLFGCRAFEPEAIIVNRAPETYIIGSPAETAGAYFHFHVYWYGTDSDGFVERYVWALTDTSIQDVETDDDEEDQNFNPATNATTLEIGTYTARTDSVFDFRINQGATLSYDMTLHMVAIDNRGDFDRTPARLHFFSNALENPEVLFYRHVGNDSSLFVDYDTIAFGDPLFLSWTARTANTTGYDPNLLADRDTVGADDGVQGFKWRIVNEGDCNNAVEDCWNPRDFDEASGDSFSYFGDVTELRFLNDGSGDGVFGRLLDAGSVDLLVNTLDIAGVQVPAADQLLHILVNYDPDTHILNHEQDWAEANADTIHYPIYTVFHGPQKATYNFADGDTVPDRSYVTFKAMGWDDHRDELQSTSNRMVFQGRFNAGQFIRGGSSFFPFSTTFSDTHQTPEWTALDVYGVSSDTLGFMVGPFDYDVIIRSVDEHGVSDGTPDTLSFVGNFPPCVQCIEIGNDVPLTPAWAPETSYQDMEADNCYDQSCLDDVTTLYMYDRNDIRYADHATDRNVLSLISMNSMSYWINAAAGIVTHTEPAAGDWIELPSYQYSALVYFHGKDHVREHWQETEGVGDPFAHRRVKAWRYQIDYEGDEPNRLEDGGGRDNIDLLTGFPIAENDMDDPIFIDDDGVWGTRISVAVPFFFMLDNLGALWSQIRDGTDSPPYPDGGTDEEIRAWQEDPAVQMAYKVWHLAFVQFTPASIQAIAVDQSRCAYRNNTNSYHFYDGTRVPPVQGRQCLDRIYDVQPDPDTDPTGILELGRLDLEEFAAFSNHSVPVVKDFRIEVYLMNALEPFIPGTDPPGWLAD